MSTPIPAREKVLEGARVYVNGLRLLAGDFNSGAPRGEYEKADDGEAAVMLKGAAAFIEHTTDVIKDLIDRGSSALTALTAADDVMGALDARVNLTTLLPAGPLQVWVDAHKQVRAALEKARGKS